MYFLHSNVIMSKLKSHDLSVGGCGYQFSLSLFPRSPFPPPHADPTVVPKPSKHITVL